MEGSSKGSSRARQGGAPSIGPVMIIGGAEDKLKDKVILHRFCRLAGGPQAHVVIVSTASSLGDQATEFYAMLFRGMGIGRVSGVRPLTREEANDPEAAALVDSATGIFLTGGNQLRLSLVVEGTALGRAIVAARDRGVVVAGTSAGASAVSSHMIAFGASGATPKHRMAQIARGLGLLDGLVVDQHFEQRTRLGRLLAIVAQSPSLLGLGIDEDTAAVVEEGRTLEVIGRGAVTIVDGSNVLTDAFQTKGHRPMMVSGVVLHSLPSGYRFDLETRSLLPRLTDAGERARRPKAAPPEVAKLARTMAAEGADSFTIDRRQERERRIRGSKELVEQLGREVDGEASE
jgi:cyanophycinase